ncbi:hypothetical protein N9A86_05570, partial [Akkermansiaceae bacterium]|nr:hypothetical protein [Akkermansiaceae bacterium]
MPLNGHYSGSAGSFTEAEALAQLMDLKAQVGENNGNFKVGFNGIYGGEATLARNCRLARDNNMSHAVIINVQTHVGPNLIQNIAAADFRNYQWRRDGVTWEGNDPLDDRDWQVVTPSRYATTLRTKFKSLTDAKSRPIKRVMDDYPGIIISVNACIEEELAVRGQATPYLADYSPFAITEFRDWLRHTGMYDADTGAYPTEGAPAAIVGNFVSINGKMRSPFYDDPSPSNSNGTGTSFNAKSGTSFSTWTLRNWDLTAYPDPITDPNFDPTPSSGLGYTAGGFDAPRDINGTAFWRAWSWDFADRGDTFPPGNPSAPAYGFRQTMIRNFVNDVLLWIEEEGIPAELITAHQIPAEMLFSDARARSSASPIWSGLSKCNGTVGITRYGTINNTQVQYITQYTDDWGIYEWHPRQGETDEAVLKNRTLQELDIIYDNNCRIVCPFTWNSGVRHPEYPVANSGFAEGLKEWLAEKVAEQHPVPTSGLVAHWPLDEGTGTTASDASGYDQHGTLLNGASWGSDATRASYVSFDGDDDRIDTGFSYALSDTDDFTWTWWANKQSPSGADTGAIMVGNRYGGTGSESLEFIKLTPNQGQFANTGDPDQIDRYSYANRPTGQWHHYAMVKSGTSYQWYVDGVAEGAPITLNYNETFPVPFFIGGDDDGSGTKVNEHFQGYIDDVVLYRSALTSQDVNNVINGIYDPIVTMVILGSPEDSNAGSTWSDGLPAHSGARYVVPATGNLRGDNGENTFPGITLTVQAGGKFQVRAIESDIATVNDLILEGGASFSAGQFAELAAGTGEGVTNVIDGNMTQSGATRLVTYSPQARSLKVLSRINGDGTLQVTGEGAIIDNAANNFSGAWEVANGSSLIFENAGAVGSADIEVQSSATLEIKGDWTQDATLTVANASGTEVKIGTNAWKVSSLTLGGSPVADGIYSPSELSALGSTVFTGSGSITAGPPQLIAGWDFWNSNTAPSANVTASGITATATASTASGNWSTTDDGSSGRGSSGDTTWGSFDGNGTPASAVTTGTGANMTATNGVTDAQITFTITNNGATDWNLD